MRTRQRRTNSLGLYFTKFCTPFAIFAARSIALRFCRGAMVGACKLLGRDRGGVASAPSISDVRESERRGETKSPCADAGRELELEEEKELDRDSEGRGVPTGSLN